MGLCSVWVLPIRRLSLFLMQDEPVLQPGKSQGDGQKKKNGPCLSGCLGQSTRWVCFQGYVYVTSLTVPYSIPQGDPLSPILCVFETTCGHNSVRRAVLDAARPARTVRGNSHLEVLAVKHLLSPALSIVRSLAGMALLAVLFTLRQALKDFSFSSQRPWVFFWQISLNLNLIQPCRTMARHSVGTLSQWRSV